MKNIRLTAAVVACLSCLSVSAQVEEAGNSFVHEHEMDGYIAPTDPAVLKKLDEWQDLKFGVLFHWGLYSIPGICESWQIWSEDWITRPKGFTYESYKRWYWDLNASFNPIAFNPDQWANIMEDAGMKYMIAPGINIPENLKDLKVVCDYMNEIGKLVKENGMMFGYHNHSHEFEEVEGIPAYDFMVQNTDPEYVFYEMDVYWADNARVSPVEYFKKYPGRFTCLHIKDVAEVGQSGKVGFDAIFRNFDISGTKDIVVEMEGSSYSEEEGGILRTCKESAQYLIDAPFVK